MSGGLSAGGGGGMTRGASVAVERAEAKAWIHTPVVRAMSVTGSASLLSGLLSAVAAKTMATVGGPAAVAMLTTLQQLRQAAVVGATANGHTALVQGSSALSGVRRAEYVRTVALMFTGMTSLVVAAMVFWPQPLGMMAGLRRLGTDMIPWLAVSVILSSVAVFLGALLNTLGGVGRLAVLSVVASGAMAVGTWPAARAFARGQSNALVALLIFAPAVMGAGAVAALAGFRRELASWFWGAGRWWISREARSFGAMSAAMFASGLISSGALLLVRGHIAGAQGMAVTGQFDAAWGLSMNQVTVVLSSLQTYYFPAVARSRSAAERDAHISSVLTVAALAGAAAIAAIAVLKPWLLTLFYSAAFRPAAVYLRWTLLGDYLKISSWILSIPILAAADMKMFLAADVAAFGVFVTVAFGLASSLTAAVSAAVAFVAMYAVHLLLCGLYLWGKLRYVPTLRATAAWASGLCLVAAVSALTWRQT